MRFLLLISLFTMLSAPLFSQEDADAFEQDNANKFEQLLKLTHLSLNEEFVTIDYEIPFGGMVEFRLYRPLDGGENKLVWQTQHVRQPGEHDLKLRKKLLPNGPYHYTFHYKGANQSGEFTVEGGKDVATDAAPIEEENTDGGGTPDEFYDEYDFDFGE